MASPQGGTLPPWDSANPGEQGLVSSSIKDRLKDKMSDPGLKDLRHMDLLPTLLSLGAVDIPTLLRVGSDPNPMGKLIQELEVSPTWKLHSFLRALAKSNQQSIITVLGFEPDDYEDPPTPARPEVGGTERERSLEGYSVTQGIEYMEQYMQEMYGIGDHPVLQYVEAHPHEYELILTNPLRVHVLSEMVASGFYTMEDLNPVNMKIFGYLDNIVMKTGKMSALTRFRKTNPFPECQELFSVKGLIDSLKKAIRYRQAITLYVCSKPDLHFVLQLACNYVARYEPDFLDDIVFMIRACLLLQTENQDYKNNDLTQALLQLPAAIDHWFPPSVLFGSLTDEQATKLDEISNIFQDCFSGNAEPLKESGLLPRPADTNHESKQAVLISNLLAKFTPEQRETVCSQTAHCLLPCICEHDGTRPPGIPEELYRLSREYQKAYEEACAGGTQTVCQCRVMIVGYEGAGKTNLLNTLLGRDFQEQHIMTNGMEVEINKTRNWSPIKVDSEFKDKIADFMIDNVQTQVKTPPKQTPITTVQDEGKTLPPRQSTNKEPAEKQCAPREEPERTPLEDVKPETPAHQDNTRDDLPEDIKLIAGRKLHERADSGLGYKSELSFWDSGGQGLYYHTTKTFLTRRCVYIIATDMTKGLDETVPSLRKNRHDEDVPDKGCPQSVREHLRYWFSCIHTFLPSDSSSTVKVIVVGTHKDECTVEEEKQFHKAIREFLEDMPYSPHYHGLFTISNKQRDDTDVSKLREKILKFTDTQAYKVPLSWFAFKEKLIESGKAKQVPTMTWAEATEIGPDIDVLAALSFFHEVGDIIFFNEPSLRDFVITDPRWLIQEFRKVITVPTYHQQVEFPGSISHWKTLDEKGILHEDVLKHVWLEGEREPLVSLMMKFALLLPVPVDSKKKEDKAMRYLVPCLLPLSDTPPTADRDRLAPPLLLLPPNQFMPVGLTSRIHAGLVNEDGWILVGKIYGNAATFLPKPKASVQITISQEPGSIAVRGKRINLDKQNADFSQTLKVILDRLEAITASVCPLGEFSLAVSCPDCGGDSHIDLGYRGEEMWCEEQPDTLEEELYCEGHGCNCKVSEWHVWFSDCPLKGPNMSGGNGKETLALWDSANPEQKEIVNRNTLYKRLLLSKLDVLTENVRLVDMWPTLIALRVIDWKEKDRIVLQDKSTPGDHVTGLVDHLQRGPIWRLHGFLRALVKANQGHIITLIGLEEADYEDPDQSSESES